MNHTPYRTLPRAAVVLPVAEASFPRSYKTWVGNTGANVIVAGRSRKSSAPFDAGLSRFVNWPPSPYGPNRSRTTLHLRERRNRTARLSAQPPVGRASTFPRPTCVTRMGLGAIRTRQTRRSPTHRGSDVPIRVKRVAATGGGHRFIREGRASSRLMQMTVPSVAATLLNRIGTSEPRWSCSVSVPLFVSPPNHERYAGGRGNGLSATGGCAESRLSDSDGSRRMKRRT